MSLDNAVLGCSSEAVLQIVITFVIVLLAIRLLISTPTSVTRDTGILNVADSDHSTVEYRRLNTTAIRYDKYIPSSNKPKLQIHFWYAVVTLRRLQTYTLPHWVSLVWK